MFPIYQNNILHKQKSTLGWISVFPDACVWASIARGRPPRQIGQKPEPIISRGTAHKSLPPGGRGTTKWWKEPAWLWICTNFIVTHSPSVFCYAKSSSLPEGAFGLCVPKVSLLFLTSTDFVGTKAIFYFNFSFIFAISSLNPSRKPYQLSFTL